MNGRTARPLKLSIISLVFTVEGCPLSEVHCIQQFFQIQTQIQSKQSTGILTKRGAKQGAWCLLDLSVDTLLFLRISKR